MKGRNLHPLIKGVWVVRGFAAQLRKCMPLFVGGMLKKEGGPVVGNRGHVFLVHLVLAS